MLYPVEDDPRQPHPLTTRDRARIVNALRKMGVEPVYIPGDARKADKWAEKALRPRKAPAQPWEVKPARKRAA